MSDDVSQETKAYPEFTFQHKFSFLLVGPIQCGKTFFVEKFSQRVTFFTRARNRGEDDNTIASGRIDTK